MNEITGNIEAAAAGARDALQAAAQRSAQSAVGDGQREFEAPMKESVRKELFAEALLGAAHSRFAEIKTAADSSR